MKYTIFALILMFSTASFADVYVVYDKKTNEVISISNEDDCMVSGDMKLKVLKNKKLKDIVLGAAPTMYFFKGNKFEPNFPKLQAKETEDLKKYSHEQEEYAIRKYTKNKNIDEMIAGGHEFKHEHHLK